jgi:hypothetical protein
MSPSGPVMKPSTDIVTEYKTFAICSSSWLTIVETSEPRKTHRAPDAADRSVSG